MAPPSSYAKAPPIESQKISNLLKSYYTQHHENASVNSNPFDASNSGSISSSGTPSQHVSSFDEPQYHNPFNSPFSDDIVTSEASAVRTAAPDPNLKSKEVSISETIPPIRQQSRNWSNTSGRVEDRLEANGGQRRSSAAHVFQKIFDINFRNLTTASTTEVPFGTTYPLKLTLDESLQEVLERMDSKTFDVKSAFREVVGTSSIKSLLDFGNYLTFEIKALDGDMQSLVYENYTEFIAASHIIRSIRTNFDSMEGKLEGLGSNMEIIQESAKRVNKAVLSRSTKIEELVAVRNLFSKLNLIFNIPNYMWSLIDEGRHGEAIHLYLIWEPFFKRHVDIQKIQQTYKKCKLVGNAGKTDALKRLGCLLKEAPPIDCSMEEYCEGVEAFRLKALEVFNMLLGLKENESNVLKLYIQHVDGLLSRFLKYIFHSIEKLQLNEMNETTIEGGSSKTGLHMNSSHTLEVLCDELTKNFIESLVRFVNDITTLFDKKRIETREIHAPIEELKNHNLKAMLNEVPHLLTKRCYPISGVVHTINCLRVAVDSVYEEMIPREMELWFEVYIECFIVEAVNSRFRRCYQEIFDVIYELYDACSTVLIDELIDRIAAAEKEFLVSACQCLSECLPFVSSMLVTTVKIDRRLRDVLKGLTINVFDFFCVFCKQIAVDDDVASHGVDAVKELFSEDMESETRVLLYGLIDRVRGWEWRPLYALSLLRIGRHLEMTGAYKVIVILTDTINLTPPSQLVNISVNITAQADVIASPIIQRIRESSLNVLAAYVSINADELLERLCGSIQELNWVIEEEAVDARPVINTILERISSMDVDVGRVLGDPRRLQADESYHRGVARMITAARSRIELEMERHYARKLVVHGGISFSRAAAIAYVIRIILKSTIEVVRRLTFNTNGVRQLQLDFYFLLDCLRESVYAEDTQNTSSLVDELVYSAYERCLDAVEATDDSDDGVMLTHTAIEKFLRDKSISF